MKTPINGKVIRQHLTYSWWKYILATALAVFLVNIYYTTSTYRPPEEKKVNLYVYGFVDEAGLRNYMSTVQKEQMSDMEEMEPLSLTTDNAYGPMQLSTYIAAGEGDIYMLPRDQFVSLAAEGAFVPLEEDEEMMNLFTDAGVSLQSGWRRTTESGETHLYGIPLDKLPGLARYVMVENGYAAVLVTNRNDENVLKFLRIMCGDMLQAP
ncbi:MAG: hypothetical protein K5922_10315 [Clostridiales bacterium]|nr:hypothetical protein [Clostridiales bacterium]